MKDTTLEVVRVFKNYVPLICKSLYLRSSHITATGAQRSEDKHTNNDLTRKAARLCRGR